jgi:hypothetical protein
VLVTPAKNVELLARDEHGGVLVTAVLFLPVLVLFITFVIDVGNWFEHKRHLQLQADAGALAGGGGFTVPCADDPIVDETRKYAGDPGHGAPYNLQVAPTDQGNVHVLVNSDRYWNEGGTDYSDGGPPCAARMVDVKITESSLPWFFGLDVVPAINAHARVEIRALNRSRGALPVAVPDTNPTVARATFVNNVTGAVLASTRLTKTTVANGLGVWDNAAAPLSVPISTAHVGVRIALGGGSSTTCGDPLVACYDLGSAGGIVYARGYSATGSGAQPNPPVARSVTLFPGSCPDPYFSTGTTTCTVGMAATVDFGGLAPANAKLTAVLGNSRFPLAYDAADGVWRSAATIPVAPAGGPVPITLGWEETAGTVNGLACNDRGNNPCLGTFGVVQQAFGGSDARSGPIRTAQIWENGSFWANSFALGTTHDLVVRIGILGNLQNASDVNDPLVLLRVTGSQNQSVDCDPALPNLRDEIAQGCEPHYAVNAGTTCPATHPALWSTPQPWDCVAIQTGGAVGQVEHGLRDRILGGSNTCTAPNNWSSFPNIPPDDPRIVPVFITPFGTFTGSGNEVVPVTGFATFYVTGWFSSPCTGDDPVPERGYIVGHFIKYISRLNEGGAGPDACDFNAFESCVAVLTE